MEFDITASDPRTQAQFEQDESAFRSDLGEDVKAGKLTQANLDQMLRQRLQTYQLLHKGVRSLLTLSSDGQKLVGLRRQGSKTNSAVDQALIVSGDRLYIATMAGGDAAPGLKVTTPAMYSSYQAIPFLGSQLPGLPPLIEFHRDKGPTSATLQFPPIDSKSKSRSVAATVVYSPSPSGSIQSVTVGPPTLTSLRWELADYTMRDGVSLPSTVRREIYATPELHHPTEMISFRLASFRKQPLADEDFHPEHFLVEKSIVQDDFPKRSGKMLAFEFKNNGTSLEDQANKHDLLEVGLAQRARREQVPSTSYAGIFGIVGVVIAGAAAYRLNRGRTKN